PTGPYDPPPEFVRTDIETMQCQELSFGRRLETRLVDVLGDKGYDHYLVALDPTTKEVYFISGPDIYLSKVLPLYYSTQFSNKYEVAIPFRDWTPSAQHYYVLDRLHQYGVEVVGSQHELERDEEKIVFLLPPTLYGYGTIKATVYFDNPEVVEVEIR
ncbi:MAG: hypothetical protein KDC54_22760, partial [Lewinella sp.]|nr:hypothetical protein [Lewinella sp.]